MKTVMRSFVTILLFVGIFGLPQGESCKFLAWLIHFVQKIEWGERKKKIIFYEILDNSRKNEVIKRNLWEKNFFFLKKLLLLKRAQSKFKLKMKDWKWKQEPSQEKWNDKRSGNWTERAFWKIIKK